MNALVVPSHIGKYEVLSLLGSGGMGRVYLALDPDIGRQVAIKQVTLSADSEARTRFVREAQAMGRLNHPNIITLLEYGVDGDTPFLVLELLSGVDLSVWMKAPHTLREYLQVMLDIAQAIDTAHKAGVLHRDLKPDNVRVLDDGRCKLLDFGIAQTGSLQITALGYFVGTPEFAAPEVICGLQHSIAGDIYALGLLYYVLLTGENPFRADTIEATVARIVQVTPVPLNERVKNVPAPVLDFIAACMSKKPENRPVSAATIVEQLQKCLINCDSQAQIIRVAPDQTRQAKLYSQTSSAQILAQSPKKKRLKAILSIVAITVITSALVVVFLWDRPSSQVSMPSPRKEQVGLATSETESRSQNNDAALPAVVPVEPSIATEVLPKNGEAAPTTDEKSGASDPVETTSTSATPPLVEAPVIKPPVKLPAKQEISVQPKPAPVPILPSETPSQAPDLEPARPVEPDEPPSLPVADAPIPTPSTNNAPEPIKLVISRYGPRALKAGRTATLRIDGVGVDRVDAASVVLGGAIDTRFRIGAIHHDGKSTLELNIAVARGVPFGSYVLVLEGAGMLSKSLSIEVSL